MPAAPPRPRGVVARWVLAGSLLAAGALSLCGSGCGPLTGPAAPAVSRPRYGYVYVARLMDEHPLYEQLRRLEQQIGSLNPAVVSPPPPSPIYLQLRELALAAPDPAVFPLTQFASRRGAWERKGSLVELPASSPLAPDLAAQLSWSRSQLEDHLARQLDQVRSDEALRVSEIRATAVRVRQEQFNNAALNLDTPDKDVAASAEAERQRLWEEIEQETRLAREAAAGRLREYHTRLEEELTRDLAKVQADIWARQRERLETLSKSGSKTRAAMSKTMDAPEAPAVVPAFGYAPPPLGKQTGPGRSAPSSQARQQRMVADLLRRRGRLIVQLERSTRTTLVGLAALQGIQLAFPPEDEPEGKDLTESLRPALRDTYHGR